LNGKRIDADGPFFRLLTIANAQGDSCNKSHTERLQAEQFVHRLSGQGTKPAAKLSKLELRFHYSTNGTEPRHQLEQKVASVQGVSSAKVEITFEPAWDRSMMSEAAQLELGFM